MVHQGLLAPQGLLYYLKHYTYVPNAKPISLGAFVTREQGKPVHTELLSVIRELTLHIEIV